MGYFYRPRVCREGRCIQKETPGCDGFVCTPHYAWSGEEKSGGDKSTYERYWCEYSCRWAHYTLLYGFVYEFMGTWQLLQFCRNLARLNASWGIYVQRQSIYTAFLIHSFQNAQARNCDDSETETPCGVPDTVKFHVQPRLAFYCYQSSVIDAKSDFRLSSSILKFWTGFEPLSWLSRYTFDRL